jgi:hypothetical protein
MESLDESPADEAVAKPTILAFFKGADGSNSSFANGEDPNSEPEAVQTLSSNYSLKMLSVLVWLQRML